MKPRFYLLLAAGYMLTGCGTQARQEPGSADYPHYEIHLKADPVSRQISVAGTLSLSLPAADSLVFYLDQGPALSSFLLDQEVSAIRDTRPSDIRYMPNAHRLVLPLAGHGRPGDQAMISFSYQGALSQPPEMFANKISGEWTELGMYFPWFPYSMQQLPLFTYRVTVEAPPGFKVFGLGSILHEHETITLSADYPISDIVICLSRQISIHTAAVGQNQLRIFYNNFSPALAEELATSITQMVEQFSQWFGPINMDLSLIESPRSTGGGYARRGGVVLAGIDEEAFYQNTRGYDRYFGHEFAHLWWHKANVNSWEDWLNESFAEYSALMFLREKYGTEEFERRISAKKENLAGTPPIWEFDRQGAEYALVNEVIYNKGPVLLSELEAKIGKREFLDLCKKLFQNDINTTAGLLATLESNHGKDIAVFLGELLSTR